MTHEASEDSRILSHGANEPLRVLWTGRSGRRYVLRAVDIEGFALEEGQLYALVSQGTIRWAGISDDIITDHVSRARFRAALGDDTSIMTLPAPADELARMTLVWDLEGTHARPSLTAA